MSLARMRSMLGVTLTALQCLEIVVVWRTTLLGNEGEKWPLDVYSSISSVRVYDSLPYKHPK